MTTITKEQLIADIAHAEEKAKSLCGPCADDHVRLAHWLRIALASLEAVPVAMSDHRFRELVNTLRDIAIEYHGTQQLRERIARACRAAMLKSSGE